LALLAACVFAVCLRCLMGAHVHKLPDDVDPLEDWLLCVRGVDDGQCVFCGNSPIECERMCVAHGPPSILRCCRECEALVTQNGEDDFGKVGGVSSETPAEASDASVLVEASRPYLSEYVVDPWREDDLGDTEDQHQHPQQQRMDAGVEDQEGNSAGNMEREEARQRNHADNEKWEEARQDEAKLYQQAEFHHDEEYQESRPQMMQHQWDEACQDEGKRYQQAEFHHHEEYEEARPQMHEGQQQGNFYDKEAEVLSAVPHTQQSQRHTKVGNQRRHAESGEEGRRKQRTHAMGGDESERNEGEWETVRHDGLQSRSRHRFHDAAGGSERPRGREPGERALGAAPFRGRDNSRREQRKEKNKRVAATARQEHLEEGPEGTFMEASRRPARRPQAMEEVSDSSSESSHEAMLGYKEDVSDFSVENGFSGFSGSARSFPYQVSEGSTGGSTTGYIYPSGRLRHDVGGSERRGNDGW